MIDDMLKRAVAAGASDVHVNVGSPPIFRIRTLMEPCLDLPIINTETASRLARQMMDEDRWRAFEHKRDADFSYEVAGLGRFRVNAHFQRGSVALSLRTISEKLPELSQLLLPEVVGRLTQLPRGLVLVTGPTGCGKSTTLAGMIDAINQRERLHIVTLEDPVEYVLTNRQCVIEQREIGLDVPDFASGLRHVLRQDPDVILVGEMRDLETTSAAITAAETGHLVLSSLHTSSAPQTIERIIDLYPSDQQSQVRSMLGSALQAVISQTLFRRQDQAGMIPAAEIMICTPAVRNCIRENRIFEIPNIIETSKAQGMQSLDSAIRQLLMSGYISRADAVAHANQPDKLERAMVA